MQATRQAEGTMKAKGVADLVQQQRCRLLKWAGKVARVEDGRWSQEVLDWCPEGLRAQGRPRTRWTDQLIPSLRQKLGNGVDLTNWMTTARNETLWNELADDFRNYPNAEPF